jgi:riboflavin synthase
VFTGIIEEVGSVKEIRKMGKEARIVISSQFIQKELAIGESVCANGVCLTVVEKGDNTFAADISEESIQRSTLIGLKSRAEINLERALTLASRLGGHIVQGHVDGVGKVKEVKAAGVCRTYIFMCPEELRLYMVEKGSIAVDGISLTISSLGEESFSVSAIPHTVEQTNLKQLKQGDPVNLEVDIISKYVKSYMVQGLAGRKTADRNDESLYGKLLEGGFAL